MIVPETFEDLCTSGLRVLVVLVMIGRHRAAVGLVLVRSPFYGFIVRSAVLALGLGFTHLGSLVDAY